MHVYITIYTMLKYGRQANGCGEKIIMQNTEFRGQRATNLGASAQQI